MAEDNNAPGNSRKTKGGPTIVDEYVGSRLRQRRTLLGWSQERLADSVNITFQQIQKYERGLNRISASRLFQFSQTLSVPVSYFFDDLAGSGTPEGALPGLSDNEQEPFGGKEKNILDQKETIELIQTYYSIKDPKVRKDLLNLIKSMAETG